MKFNFEDGGTKTQRMGSQIVGVQRKGCRPTSVTLDREDFEYLLGGLQDKTIETVRYIHTLYISLERPSPKYDGYDLGELYGKGLGLCSDKEK